MTSYDSTNWRTEKILTLEQARAKAQVHRQEGQRIVTLNGAFDILHAGHLDQLEEAKQQGDILFVGINSDSSVRQGKGETRPIVPEQARAALLAALACVDYVVVVDASYDTVPAVLIETVMPHVHVNGPDYGPPSTWTEWPAMQKAGAEGYTVQRRNDISTSDIIDHVKKLS